MERDRSRGRQPDRIRDSSLRRVLSGLVPNRFWEPVTDGFHLKESVHRISSYRNLPAGWAIPGKSPSDGSEKVAESRGECAKARDGGHGRKAHTDAVGRAGLPVSPTSVSCKSVHSGPASVGYAMSGKRTLHTAQAGDLPGRRWRSDSPMCQRPLLWVIDGQVARVERLFSEPGLFFGYKH